MSKEERDIVAEIIEERDGNREEVVANKDVSDSILDKAFPLVTANIPSLDAAVEKLEKSIKCSLCNYSCVRNKNLTQHLKKFHKLNKEERESIKESKNNGGMTLGKNADVSESESFPVSIISESDDLALGNVDVESSENKCNVCGLTFDSFSSCLKHQL